MIQQLRDEVELEAGHWLFTQKCRFCFGVVDMEGLPPADRIEVAFAGRSNVGKSSLINTLTNHKDLARTSSTPGRTQELNFFMLAEGTLKEGEGVAWLVDLPGYGYAREEKKKINIWNMLLRNYLSGRRHLSRVFLLIDARHGLKENDLDMMDMLDEVAVSYQIVMTKSDKVKQEILEKTYQKICHVLRKRPAAHPEVLITSSIQKKGIPELRSEIARFLDISTLRCKDQG